MLRKKVFIIPMAALALLALAACTPQTGLIVLDSPAAAQAERTATAAWHRMQLGYLEMGEYTTNVLVDLDLPRGVRWTLEDFSESSYRLRFTSEAVPGVAWFVSPDGVTAGRTSR